MKYSSRIFRGVSVVAIVGGTLLSVVNSSSGTTPPMYGALSNFDVFNDTGQVTHGFEVELDGISPLDVPYEFGAPYERYGNPTVTSIHGGLDTLITYASPYDAAAGWQVGTPIPAAISTTMGHECWTGGSTSYATLGCEHFGFSLSANPTNVIYNWLIADPAHAGHLVAGSSTSTGLPILAPSWNVQPQPNNAPPKVQAVVIAPEKDGAGLCGDAVWVKVFMNQAASKASLGHLMSGDKEVPTKADTSSKGSNGAQSGSEPILIQTGGQCSADNGSVSSQIQSELQLSKNGLSVVRRYEFYKYTGSYDSESHEALSEALSTMGTLTGNQMVALNLNQGAALDLAPPTVTITTTSPGTTKLKTLSVTFSAKDNVSKTFTFFCSLDGAIPKLCTSGLKLAGLSVRTHTLSVYASDQAANASKAARLTWKVTT